MLIDPSPLPRGARFAVVASRFNESITSRLLEGALARLKEKGYSSESAAVDVVRVPGAFEIPSAAKRLALTGRYVAIVALGALVKGETPHFHYISRAVSQSLSDLALETNTPVAFGVLTCDTEEQALARTRADSEFGHKGAEAADAALEMAGLFAAIGPVR